MSKNEHDFRHRPEQNRRKVKRQKPGVKSGRDRGSGGQKRIHSDRMQSSRGLQRPVKRRRRRRKNAAKRLLLSIAIPVFIVVLCSAGFLYYRHNEVETSYVVLYETNHYNQAQYKETLFATDLCVAAEDVALNGFEGDMTLHAAGLFDLNQKQVLYADRIHEQHYPASTTKLMTAYLTLRYGNLDDIVTVSDTAVAFVDPEATLCGLEAGDQLTLYDLLCGLILQSGNDNAAVIAEYLGGSIDGFVEMMNNQATALGATHTHFANPHGLHDDNHYTTAYDLYLIFNECIKDQRFLDIISMKSYNASWIGIDGSTRTDEWTATNYYSAGLAEMPPGVQVVGGKTGTTNEAGSCVILYNIDSKGNPLISIVMGAYDKELLYNDMTSLLLAGTKN